MPQFSKDSIVVTGVGALTPLGHSAFETYQAIKAGQTGITSIQQWDVSHWEYPLGAEIKNYDPRTLISDRKLLKLISKQDVIGLNAVNQALNDSQLLEYRENLNEVKQIEFNDKTGVFVGSPGNRFEQQYDFLPLFANAQGNMKSFGEKIFDVVHPTWLLRILPNNVLAYVGIQHGFKGINHNIVNHAISGLQAIAEACRFLRQGLIERAVVVAYESAIEPEGQMYYGRLGLLSPDGLYSFSSRRSGTVLAEGSGCIILERAECAMQRSAKIYGEIVSDAVVSEAQGVFSICESGDGVKRAIELALKHGQLQTNDIGFVAAHGNGTLISDAGEGKAISAIFGDKKIPVTAFKWALGHTLSAAGVIETILTLLSLQEHEAPGLPYLDAPAHDCETLQLSSSGQPIHRPSAMIIGRAFASLDACLIVRL